MALQSSLESRFYESCLAVKNMGIEIRDIRKKLVSNIMGCMEERLKLDSAMVNDTRSVACQYETLKAFKGRNIGCQYNGTKKKRTKDASCQHCPIKKFDGAVDVGTNTETFEVGSDIEQTSNKLERKRKREDSSLNSCSATWRKKPNLHQKKKRKITDGQTAELALPDSANRKEQIGCVLSSFSPMDEVKKKSLRTDDSIFMPNPEDHVHHIEHSSHTRYKMHLIESRESTKPPGIPQQDSIMDQQKKNSHLVSNRKSMRLILNKRDILSLLPSDSVVGMPSVSCGSSEACVKTVIFSATRNSNSDFMSKRKTVQSPEHIARGPLRSPLSTNKTKDKKPFQFFKHYGKEKTNQGASLKTQDKDKFRERVYKKLNTTSGGKMLANAALMLDDTVCSPTVKKRKTLLGNRKLEAFKLSVVDDKEYERTSIIRVDTSSFAVPRPRPSLASGIN